MTVSSINPLHDLLDDRPADGVFKIARRAYTDPAIFDLEIRHIFEGTWNFVGLESQVARPYDFITARLGRQPILITRDQSGQLSCVLNSCTHRGALLVSEKQGNRRTHVCPYHGWAFDAAGRKLRVNMQDAGGYPASFASMPLDLVRVPRFASYRGLMFASMNPEVPPLEEYLGDARVLLDLVIDQAPNGLELVEGETCYTFGANWKLQLENGLDFYHFATTHASYVDILRRRLADQNPEGRGLWIDDENYGQGTFSFPNGHAVMWANRNSLRVKRPILHDEDAFERIKAKVGAKRAKWMLLNRNLTIFPNLQIIDVHSLQLRLWEPLAPNLTRMRAWCLAPIGESREARVRRIRQYEDFFNPTGLATSDDNVMYELCQAGFAASESGHSAAYLRGMGLPQATAFSEELGISPVDAVAGTFEFGGETCLHACYREWFRLLTN